MEQFDNQDKYTKIKKRRTPYEKLKIFRKNTCDDIKALRGKDIGSAMAVLTDIMKYPVLYLLCIYAVFKLGLMVNSGMSEEQFNISKGNVYHLLGNLVFLLILDILLKRSGRNLRSEFSLFRDYRILCHMKGKSLKAKFKGLAKKGKKIFSKGVTAKSVGAQYFLHFVAGIALGTLFLSLFLMVYDGEAYIRCLYEVNFIRGGRFELTGLMTFILVIPFIEELIYHAHSMTVLRKDVTVFTASVIVTVLYMLLHTGKAFTLLFIPVIFLISLVFDRTQNTRNIADYVAGRSSKSLFTGSVSKDKIISIKDRVGKGRKRRFVGKSSNNSLGLDKTKDVRVDGNIDMEGHLAEAVNDLGGIHDSDKEYNITDFSSERPEGAKPDITYSLLMNVGYHLMLGAGWISISYRKAAVDRIFSRQVLMFMIIVSVLILYKFIKKQHLFEMNGKSG